MIKQITEKSIGHRVRFHFFYTNERWLFFKVDRMPKNIKSLAVYLDDFMRNNRLSSGVYLIETVIENKIFEVLFDEREITEEKVIEFAKTLGL